MAYLIKPESREGMPCCFLLVCMERVFKFICVHADSKVVRPDDPELAGDVSVSFTIRLRGRLASKRFDSS